MFALAIGASFAQDPCKLEFENEWVRISRVTYPPFGKSKTHAHPATPTLYGYTTGGGPIHFLHAEGYSIDRPAVKAGGIFFNRGMVEQHEVERLSDIRIQPAENRGFENAQIGIEKPTCEPHQMPPGSRRPEVRAPLGLEAAASSGRIDRKIRSPIGRDSSS